MTAVAGTGQSRVVEDADRFGSELDLRHPSNGLWSTCRSIEALGCTAGLDKAAW